MITQDLGIATAYGYAKSKGYTGTEAEFAELMASYASTAQTAIEAADRAVEANTAAQSAKTDAAASKTAAQTAAQTATSKASEAVTAAGTATTKASEARQSASTASAAATSAGTSAQTATTAATTATTKASEASESAVTATTAKTDAETARDAAAQSASEAAASAESIDPEALEHKAYGAYVVESASGAIASFADGADNIPMKDVLVHVDPVQDLNGYDNPWPAGGGKNLLPYPFSDTTKTVAGITFTDLGDGKLKVNGTATGRAMFFYANHAFKPIPSGDYILSRNTTVSDVVIAIDAYNGDTYVKNIKTSGLTESPFSIDYDGYDRLDIFVYVSAGQTVSNDTISLMIRLATEIDNTYTPYSNICPITGWTGAKVTRMGKNLLPYPFSDTTKTAAGITFTDLGDGKLKVNGTATGRAMFFYANHAFKPIPSGDYILSRNTTVSDVVIAIDAYNGNTWVKNIKTSGLTESPFSIDYDGYDRLDIFVYISAGQTVSNDTISLMIRLATETDATFTPYSGQTYSITFPAEAGTVYGGALDVTKGELVVDRAQIASYNGEALPSTWISDRDVYSEGTTPTTGAQVCYYLATPITYQLTPQEITSLLGANNVWADTGDTEVEYRADTEMYITKKITEAVSALS